MTYVDPNSGAVAQPGAAIYRGPEAEAEALAAAEAEGVEENAEVVEDDGADDGNARLPEGDAGDEGDSKEEEEEASAPAKSASKGDWVDFAVSQGADREEAEESTKEQLIEAYGA